jgi:hypothetical protein
MPSWWMPLSWAKAFRPTMALLYCTGKDVTADTSFEARVQHRRVDLGMVRQHVVAHLHRHHDFFEREPAGALADASDRHFADALRSVHVWSLHGRHDGVVNPLDGCVPLSDGIAEAYVGLQIKSL